MFMTCLFNKSLEILHLLIVIIVIHKNACKVCSIKISTNT